MHVWAKSQEFDVKRSHIFIVDLKTTNGPLEVALCCFDIIVNRISKEVQRIRNCHCSNVHFVRNLKKNADS